MTARAWAIAAAVALAALRGTPEPPASSARDVVHAAQRAVEADSAAGVRDRWSARLRADPGDRAAALGLATLARLTYAYDDAARRYRALAPAAGAAPDLYAVYARLGESQVLDAQNSIDAGPLAEQARAMAHGAGDAEAEGTALTEVAFARVNATQSLAAGVAGLDTALRLLPPDALAARAHALRYRALVLTLLQDSTAAAADLEARATARRAGDRREEAQTYRVGALRLKLTGKPEAGLAALDTAEALHRAARDASGFALTSMYHAERLSDLGRYGAARDFARRGLAVARAANFPAGVAAAHSTLGGVALRTGDYPAAAAELAASDSLFRLNHDPASAVISEAQLAELSLRVGDLATARDRALRLADWFRHTGEAEGEFTARRLLVTTALRGGDAADVARQLVDAETLARRHAVRGQMPAWSADLSLLEGRVALARGDAGAAARLFTRYLAAVDSGDHVARQDARVALADAEARRGDLAGAEREMTTAADELDRWRAALADDRLRVLAFQAAAGDAVERDAAVARVVARLALGGRAPAAFALAERRRARALADRLARAEALDPTAPNIAAGTGPRAAPDAASAPVTADRVRAALPDAATALVEYVAGVAGAPTTAFVLTRDRLRAVVLAPADSLGPQAARLVALLEQGGAPASLERTLGAALLDPVAPGARVARLLVVPDGPLFGVPFDALRLADGRYAVERFAVAEAPSAGVAAALWKRPAPGGPVRLLAFGDPAFGAAPNAGTRGGGDRGGDVYRAGFAASGGLARLAGSREEARDVARYAPEADVRLGADASAAYLTHARLDGYRVLHFATHALVDEATGAGTALALAPGDGASGFVTPADLAALKLNADLVVLSACRTAGGAVVAGEGVQGLTAPLLAAGARAVVATAWRIPDRASVALVDAFYAALARGLPAADALRAAQLDAVRRGAPPREWAAFTLVGDPAARVPLVAPAPGARWGGIVLALGALGALGGACAAAAGRRRRAPAERVSARPAP